MQEPGSCLVKTGNSILPGATHEKPKKRQVAVDILGDPVVGGFNARHVMLKFKAAHGSGSDLTFPDADAINANMQDYPVDFKVDIYRDGSHTSPTVWWAALGGFGVWMFEWISPNQATCIEPPGTDVHPSGIQSLLVRRHRDQSSSSRSSLGGERVLAPLRRDEIPCSLSCVAENVTSLASVRQIAGDHPILHVNPSERIA